MTNTTIEKRLEQAIDSALADADALWAQEERYPSIPEIAANIYAAQNELMEDAKRMVLLDRLCWLIKRRKAARYAKDSPPDRIAGAGIA